MLKALNLSPWLVTDPQVQAFLASPGACDAVVTWAPGQTWESNAYGWVMTDAAVEWILKSGKRCFVAVPSSQFTDNTYAARLKYGCDTIERYPEASIIGSNEPTFAGVSHKDSAQLLRDLTAHAAGLKPGAGSTHIIGPAEADAVVTKNGVQELTYTNGVIGWLLDFVPPKGIRVDVAQHSYWDGTHGGAVATRLALAQLDRLDPRWRPNLYLSEGFFTYATHKLPGWNPADPDNAATWGYTNLEADEAAQLQRITHHYPWCKTQPRIAMWANYEDVDSLYGGWASGLIAHDGTPHPIDAHWTAL